MVDAIFPLALYKGYCIVNGEKTEATIFLDLNEDASSLIVYKVTANAPISTRPLRSFALQEETHQDYLHKTITTKQVLLDKNDFIKYFTYDLWALLEKDALAAVTASSATYAQGWALEAVGARDCGSFLNRSSATDVLPTIIGTP